MPANERAELFAETADRKGLADAIVEKDFWVCWVQNQLFSIDVLSGRLLFKGGTSLSKIFRAISRLLKLPLTLSLSTQHRSTRLVNDIELGGLQAPFQPSLPHKKMSATTCLLPNRRRECRPAEQVHLDGPPVTSCKW
jgi:hypothetical protein